MASPGRVSKDLLGLFKTWADSERDRLLTSSIETRALEGEVSQNVIFQEDCQRYIHTFTQELHFEAASFAQSIATLASTPIALFAELYRLYKGTITAYVCLQNICLIPVRIIATIIKTAFYMARTVNKMVRGASIGVGFLVWHGGERLVRLFTKSPHTILSNNFRARNIVYHSLGLTLLAAATVFIPIAPIQMIALPIIIGSIYGTINNQFTVRECPEYYTMGNYYDGTDLKGHAIKTNNVLIKPIVTGCYTTTFVTKVAGLVLSAVGTIPYTAAILPIPIAGAMIAGVCVVSLIAAHLFSKMKKNKIQKNFDEYAALIGIRWTEENRNKSWNELAPIRNQCIEQKRLDLSTNREELDRFNKSRIELTNKIESYISDPQMPIKYIAGWQANNTRNTVGYLFAGGGTLAITISTIFLRIFAL